MVKRPKKPAARKANVAPEPRWEPTLDPRPRHGFVRNIDIPVGRETPPPGSMLKKPKKPKD